MKKMAFVVGVGMLSASSLVAQQPIQSNELVPAEIVLIPQISMPAEAAATGLGGNVRVLVTIDADGNVVSADDVAGPGAVCRQITRPDVVAMREAAKAGALRARFNPAMQSGKPVQSSQWLNFDFPSRKEKPYVFAPAPESPPRAEERSGGGAPIAGNDRTTSLLPPKDGSDANQRENSASDEASGRGPAQVPRLIQGGVLNGKALSLAKPPYPPAARAVRASGIVKVETLIDESGAVFSAEPVSGHPLLRAASVSAACQSRFAPTSLSGHPVKVSGILLYNFVP